MSKRKDVIVKCIVCNSNNKKGRGNRCFSCITTIRRYRQKIKAIEYKGGKCEICGYNDHVVAMQFHHLDPKEKDFIISRMAIRSWILIKTELDKCKLLCANCHSIVHATSHDSVMKEIKRISDKISKNDSTTCKCGNKMHKTSNQCRNCYKTKSKIEWPKLSSLIKMLENESCLAVARKLGVSDSAIRKHIKRAVSSEVEH